MGYATRKGDALCPGTASRPGGEADGPALSLLQPSCSVGSIPAFPRLSGLELSEGPNAPNETPSAIGYL